MAVLNILAEARGEVVTRETLLDRVWPNVTVGEESVTTAISELRRAFGEKRGSAKVIETVQRAGYRVVLPVSFEAVPVDLPMSVPSVTGFDLDGLLICQEVRRLRQSAGPLGYEHALSLCESALAPMPECVAVRAEFATTVALSTLYCGMPGSQLQEALKMAESAVRLRPDLPDGHLALGVVQGALNKRFEARYALQTALALGPGDGETFFQCARILFGFGELQNAARAAERACVLLSDDYRPLYVAAAAYQALGVENRPRTLLNAAQARLNSRLALDPEEPRTLNALAAILAWCGQSEVALEIIEGLKARGQNILYYETSTLAFAGDYTNAVRGLERMVDEGYRQSGWLRHDPGLSRLAHEPTYQKLINHFEVA